MTFRTRFAPSPTGELHLGHAYSALFARNLAKKNSGELLLRIDDLDHLRSRKVFEDKIFEDLRWLNINWTGEVLYQSTRTHIYMESLRKLWELGLLYKCSCSRRDIKDAVTAPHYGEPQFGPDGYVYPGTCRNKDTNENFDLVNNSALRLNMRKAWEHLNLKFLSFNERQKALQNGSTKQFFSREEAITTIGDVVISRNNLAASYHLSVVIDDATQKINHVVRGEDLFEASKIHTILYTLLKLPVPAYYHHKLITDSQGQRLAKRNKAKSLSYLKSKGMTKKNILELINL
jgi:glutamyl-Q tRNA(Asp) synthetase